jgi:transposase-like protein
MAVIAVRCPSHKRDTVVQRGKTTNGKQRYLCQDEACSRRTFLLDYTNRGYLLSVKRQIIALTLNGSGIRDTARVLGISTDTVLSERKKGLPAGVGAQGAARAAQRRREEGGHSASRSG